MFYDVELESCKVGFFSHLDKECRDCQDYNGDNCLVCESATLCNQCKAQSFLDYSEYIAAEYNEPELYR